MFELAVALQKLDAYVVDELADRLVAMNPDVVGFDDNIPAECRVARSGPRR